VAITVAFEYPSRLGHVGVTSQGPPLVISASTDSVGNTTTRPLLTRKPAL
jgi:hypothetical protein